MANKQGNTSGANILNHKIDMLNNSINDLVDVLEKLSVKTQSGSGGGSNNPFIRPGSRRTLNQRDQDRSFYYEWSQYYKAPKRDKKWSDMSDEEKESYNKKKNNRKQEAQDYVRRSQQREDLYRDLRSSRMGSTAFGRYATNLMERNQRIEDFGMMGKYMYKNAGKIGTGLFGTGKAGAAATKAIGGFGKAIGGASKLLGGPWVAAILMAIDALKMLGEAMNEWKKATADMIEHQNKQEELMYNRDKQKYILENQLKIEEASYNGDMQLKMLETQGATMLEALKITTEQYVKGVETAIGPLTKGINQSAYDAANARVDAAANIEKLGLHQKQREQDYRLFGEQRGLQYEGKKASIKADIGIAEAQYTADSRQAALDAQQKFEREHVYQNAVRNFGNNMVQSNDGTHIQEDTNGGNYTPINGEQMRTPTNTTEAGIGHINNPNAVGALIQKGLGFQEGQHAKEQALLHNANGVLTRAADWVKTSVDAEYQLEETKKDYAVQVANKQLEIETEKKEIIIDAAAEIKKTWLQLAQKTEQFVEQFDRVTNNLGKSLGYTNRNQLIDFQKSMITGGQVAAKFGKTYEDAAKYQQDFIESTGRNRIFDEHDYGQMFGLGEYLGDNGLASNYASQMEIFNVGVADSVDMLDNVLQDVNRIGLNGRKYTKTLVDNLKLAQKYNFKNGTKGLMEMAKWAENTRFNMNSLGGMLDKISEGGLEGVITQGAQFQVLGGHAAMNADPIAMMFERYADPEALMKRYQDMTKGYGSLDRTTGETKFSGTEQMLMEQLAKIQGRSVEDVMNEVRARNKKEVVEKQLSGDFNDEEKSFISNLANYDKKSGQFKVKVKDGNRYVDTDVSQLTKDDIDKLMPEKHEERMEDYMQTIVDLLGKITGEENREKLDMAGATFSDVFKNYADRIKEAYDSYNANREKYIEEAKKGMDEATRAFHDYIGIFENGNQDVQAAEDKITQQANAIGSALENTARIINEANGRINGNYTAPDSSTQRIRSSNIYSGNYSSRLNPNTQKVRERAKQAMSLKTSAMLTQQTDAIKKDNPPLPLASPPMQPINDGIVRGKNAPIVTKVNDSIIESDPKDVAIFAKEGGTIGKLVADLDEKLNSLNGGTIHLDTINVQISGSLDLSSGGQSVNIINELQNNPILLRALSRMLSEQLSNALNGGRGSLPISIGNV